MSSPPLAKVVEACLACLRTDRESDHWAFDLVSDWGYDAEWERVWDFLLEVCRSESPIDTESMAVLAAGPLEDLICKAGELYIDRVIREAKFNRRFGRILTGVWGGRADPAVWAKVVQFCRAFPEPIDGTYGF